jgi:hypothetical protein
VAALSTMPNSGSAMRSSRGRKTLASMGRAPRQRPPPCLPHRRWPSLGWPLELCLGDSPILPSSPASRTPPRWQPSPRLVTALSNSASAPLLQSSSAPRRIWVVTSCVTTCPPPAGPGVAESGGAPTRWWKRRGGCVRRGGASGTS